MNFYDLPLEIIRLIYSFDSTYRTVYSKMIDDVDIKNWAVGGGHRWMVRKQYRNQYLYKEYGMDSIKDDRVYIFSSYLSRGFLQEISMPIHKFLIEMVFMTNGDYGCDRHVAYENALEEGDDINSNEEGDWIFEEEPDSDDERWNI